MPDGTGGVLGEEVEPGKYVDNEIPAAKDESEAYDTRYFPRDRFKCSPFGTVTIRGPRGVVTKFKPDYKTVEVEDKYGDEVIESDGTTTCSIIPRWQVSRVSGKRLIFTWSDISCPFDNATLLELVREEDYVEESRSPLPPLRLCETDWPKWLREKLFELLKSGVSLDRAKALLSIARAEHEEAKESDAFALVHRARGVIPPQRLG